MGCDDIIRRVEYNFGDVFLKKKPIFITILTVLLLFQSVWNIAAAFCVHENTGQIVSTQHFGHHQVMTHCSQEKTSVNSNDTISENVKSFFADDHRDHLPSYTHILLMQTDQTLVIQHFFEEQSRTNMFWQNFYQSPDLTGQNPPPLLSPLLVG